VSYAHKYRTNYNLIDILKYGAGISDTFCNVIETISSQTP